VIFFNFMYLGNFNIDSIRHLSAQKLVFVVRLSIKLMVNFCQLILSSPKTQIWIVKIYPQGPMLSTIDFDLICCTQLSREKKIVNYEIIYRYIQSLCSKKKSVSFDSFGPRAPRWFIKGGQYFVVESLCTPLQCQHQYVRWQRSIIDSFLLVRHECATHLPQHHSVQ
jgi:hypothetical protein